MQKLFFMATLFMTSMAFANVSNIPTGTTVDCIGKNVQINIQVTGPKTAQIRLDQDSEFIEAKLHSTLDIDTYTFDGGYVLIQAFFGMGPDIAEGEINGNSINNLQCENTYP